MDLISCVSVFPDNCSSFTNGHSQECLLNSWVKIGCSEQGRRAPNNMTEIELEQLRRLDLKLVFLCLVACLPSYHENAIKAL